MKTKSTVSHDIEADHGYGELRSMINKCFSVYCSVGDPFFIVKADGLYDAFLSGLPEENRQHYNCHACRKFFDNFGGLVVIMPDKSLRSVLFDFTPNKFFERAIYNVKAKVERSVIDRVFFHNDKTLGTPVSNGWEHLHAEIDSYQTRHIKPLKDIPGLQAKYRQDFLLLKKAILENSISVISSAVHMIEHGSLYRREKYLGLASWIYGIKKSDKNQGSYKARENLIWSASASAPEGFCHIENTVFGDVMECISKGMSYDQIKRRYGGMMRPDKYQRPQSLPTEGNIKTASKLIAEKGLEKSLQRRYADLYEIPPDVSIWSLREPSSETNMGVFANVKRKARDRYVKNTGMSINLPCTKITVEKFLRDILPGAISLSYFTNVSNYGAFLTAEDIEAPPIIRWDSEEYRNPFSWYMYTHGSVPSKWNLPANRYHPVVSVVKLPQTWREGYESAGKGLLFVLAGAFDVGYEKGTCLFPEVLRSDLREIRKVIEEYSRENVLGNAGQSDHQKAAGIIIQDIASIWEHLKPRFSVITETGESFYQLDRWD